MSYEDYDKPIHRRPIMTDEEKKEITDFLNSHTPQGAGIVVNIFTHDGVSTFTNMEMPNPSAENETQTASN